MFTVKLDCRTHCSLIFTSFVNPFAVATLFLEARVRAGGISLLLRFTPYTIHQGAYKEPPYPAKTNSIEEQETNAFVFELYLVTVCLHPNTISHKACLPSDWVRSNMTMLSSTRNQRHFSPPSLCKLAGWLCWQSTRTHEPPNSAMLSN